MGLLHLPEASSRCISRRERLVRCPNLVSVDNPECRTGHPVGAAREAPKILASIDFTFSQMPIPPENYTLLFQDTSLNGKWNQGMDYIIPATGVTVSTVRAVRDLRRI